MPDRRSTSGAGPAFQFSPFYQAICNRLPLHTRTQKTVCDKKCQAGADNQDHATAVLWGWLWKFFQKGTNM
jgi:hypothetical protein